MNEQYGTLWEMIDKRLEGIEQSQNFIKTDIAVIKERDANFIIEVGGLKSTVYGNGKQGLVTQIALLWQKVVLISAIIGGVCSFLGALIIGFIKGK